jgi:hypothetical protein
MLIGLSDRDSNQAGVNITPDLDAATAMQLLGTLAQHVMAAFTEVAIKQLSDDSNNLSTSEREAAITGIKDSIYDAMDNVFSTVLANYRPEHPRYTLEDEAILELVNKKIEQKYNSLPKAERKRYQAEYNKMKLRLTYANKQSDTKSNRSS